MHILNEKCKTNISHSQDQIDNYRCKHCFPKSKMDGGTFSLLAPLPGDISVPSHLEGLFSSLVFSLLSLFFPFLFSLSLFSLSLFLLSLLSFFTPHRCIVRKHLEESNVSFSEFSVLFRRSVFLLPW